MPASARRKAKPDIFTVLLVIALLAIITGIVFLWLYNVDYDWDYKGAGMAMGRVGKTATVAAGYAALSPRTQLRGFSL
ncbi:MAG: hypothetical protein LLG00_03715 [Planctomycetaceae bacterium]|nr:hypothetical protein [Planctomycetaceae bacterium]